MEDFIEKLKDVLERDSINPNDVFREYDEWSSLAHLSVVVFVRQQYNKQFQDTNFMDINTVEELYNACVGN